MIGKAHQGLAFCNRLFEIERKMTRRETAPTHEERLIERERDSRPVLTEFHAWLGAMQPVVVPKSALGKAVGYCLNQWEKLGRFMEDGRLEIDNNRAERSIKPFVIGRKAWMFSNTPSGARASAVLYSLVETAKENGLDPAAWLAHLLREIPNLVAETGEALDAVDAVELRWRRCGARHRRVSGVWVKSRSQQSQSFLLDGTLSNYDKARDNVARSLKRQRLVQILYVYQEPMQAWAFVQARENTEGRRIRPEHFLDQYFAAREVVNRLKVEFGKAIHVDLLMKNNDNSHRFYKAGVDRIDNHIPKNSTVRTLRAFWVWHKLFL